MADDDLEWLDGDGPAQGPDDELPGAHRPPVRRRTKVLAGVLGAAALTALVVAGVTSGSTTSPRPAAPTASASDPSSAATEVFRPNGPPAAGLVAIRAAFPAAKVDSFVAVQAMVGENRPTQIYNVRTSTRRITVTVAPRRSTDIDVVFRTARSVRIGQQLGDSAFVDVTVTAADGPTSQRDFEAMQVLVQDGRLLARR